MDGSGFLEGPSITPSFLVIEVAVVISEAIERFVIGAEGSLY